MNVTLHLRPTRSYGPITLAKLVRLRDMVVDMWVGTLGRIRGGILPLFDRFETLVSALEPLMAVGTKSPCATTPAIRLTLF